MGRAVSGKGEGRRGAARPAENGWIELTAVRDLVHLMETNGLVELEVEREGSKIRLVREHPASAPATFPAVISDGRAVAPEPPVAVPAAEKKDHGKPIISPMVGTFYRAPNPEAAAFVEVGSIVEKGDTLCIIEAMKMMNEIEAEFRGRVSRVVATNGQTVEYGEELFLIEPL